MRDLIIWLDSVMGGGLIGLLILGAWMFWIEPALTERRVRRLGHTSMSYRNVEQMRREKS